MKTTKPEGPTEEEILAGGMPLKVRCREGTPPAFVTREVTVRLIPFTQMRSLGNAWGKEMAEAELYLGMNGRPEAEAFINSLHPEDHAAVMEQGRRLNFLSFAGWSRRSQQAVEAVTSMSSEKVVEEMLKSPEGQGILKAALDAR